MKLERERLFLLGNTIFLSQASLFHAAFTPKKIGLSDVFEKHLKIDMKTVRYSPIDKVIEIIFPSPSY